MPARAVQIFFGQIIHQVLDRCHMHYSGHMGSPKGSLPTDADIDRYFDEVEQALRTHSIHPASLNESYQAKQVLKTFNSLEGPELYKKVIDTEFRLESERQDYVLRGVVDVLVLTLPVNLKYGTTRAPISHHSHQKTFAIMSGK